MAEPKPKNRYWVGVLYPENMLPNWEQEIDDLIQVPYAYCLHNADVDIKSEHRKDHIHLIIVFPNTTTYNHAMRVFNLLSAPGKRAINTCESVINIRSKYDYLIHDTEGCRKKGKELYKPSDRIIGNNFDIGAYEQLGVAEKNAICIKLVNLIREHKFITFGDFFDFVMDNYVVEDTNYFEVLKSNSGFFERLTKSNYQKIQYKKDFGNIEPSTML